MINWSATTCALLLVTLGCTQSCAVKAPTTAAKEAGANPNIILMIGDGMGLSQLSAGMYANSNRIAFERMPVVGLQKTYSYDNLVTDSAAGATALSCGVKTYNGAIGVNPDTTSCPTLLELAEEREMPTGLVATSTIVHATPASFFGHAASRQQYELLASQLAASNVDYFVGGGTRFFNARLTDKRDLLSEMKQAGRDVHTYFESTFAELAPDPKRPFGFLTALEDPLPVTGGRSYLLPATNSVLSYLEAADITDNGFFAMIEGSQIDWGGHANNTDYIVTEMIEFSKVVDAALDYAEADGNTLVVITADHETGGFAINTGSRQDSIVGAFTSDYHTATMVPVFAMGPGAEQFAGIYENTAIYEKLKRVMLAGRSLYKN